MSFSTFIWTWTGVLLKGRDVSGCWFLEYEHDFGYKAGRKDIGVLNGDKMPDNGNGRVNFLGFLHMAWGAPRWNPAPDRQKPRSLNPPWRQRLTWWTAVSYLKGAGASWWFCCCLRGKGDWESHRCLYSATHPIVWFPPLSVGFWQEAWLATCWLHFQRSQHGACV